MNARKVAPRVAVLLIVLGLSAVGLRMSFRQKSQLRPGDSMWRMTYVVNFHADTAGARLRASFPLDTPSARVVRREPLLAPGMKTSRPRSPRSENREVSAVAPQPGDFRVTAQCDLHLSPRAVWPSNRPRADLTPTALAAYLRSETAVQTDSPTVTNTLAALRTGSSNKKGLIDWLFEYCQTEILPGAKDAPHDAAGALDERMATPLGRARAMIALCRAAKIPARLVTGVEIKLGADVQPHRWVEVLANGRWEPYDPENGFAHDLPRNFVPMRRDGAEIVRGRNVKGLHPTISIVRMSPSPGVATAGGRRLADVLDLTRLPLEMHEILSLILLMPLGALLTSIFRTVIGIRTFGTFTPTLLALSFVYADWRTGLMIFVSVMILGFASRSLLDRLKLLLVPRLSVMLTLVVLCIAFGVSLFDYFGVKPGYQVLLPMVILTMTVERFYLTSEEDGVGFALQLLAGTLVVAFCCYMILCWTTVGRMLLAHPELHCFTIAALILLGRYSGYRLTELWRFRDLAGPGA